MSSGGAVGAVVAVAAARKREALFRRFRDKGAVSPASARSLEALGLRPRPLFSIQVRKGAVVESDAGRYYLDETVVARQARTRRRVMALLAAVVAVIVAWALVAR